VIGGIVYSLCAMTALVCSYLLLQGYRRGGYRLLLWSGICFAGLTVNNLFLVLDKLIVPDIDLSLARTLVALVSMVILLYGLIWDTQ
jgi:hypothetical protein